VRAWASAPLIHGVFTRTGSDRNEPGAAAETHGVKHHHPDVSPPSRRGIPQAANERTEEKGEAMYIGGGILTLIVIILLLIWIF
jgi:hypothetical protein